MHLYVIGDVEFEYGDQKYRLDRHRTGLFKITSIRKGRESSAVPNQRKSRVGSTTLILSMRFSLNLVLIPGTDDH